MWMGHPEKYRNEPERFRKRRRRDKRRPTNEEHWIWIKLIATAVRRVLRQYQGVG
jgi:hypothetical protein